MAGFGGGGGQIGIGQDDKGVAAAEFQHAFFQVFARQRGQMAAGIGGAGKGQRIARSQRGFGVFVRQPRRLQGQTVCQLKQRRAHPRHAGGGFDQTGIARAQGGHGKTQHLPHRIVPRHHRQHHAQRRKGNAADAGLGSDGFAGEKLRRELGVIADQRQRFVDFGFALA